MCISSNLHALGLGSNISNPWDTLPPGGSLTTTHKAAPAPDPQPSPVSSAFSGQAAEPTTAALTSALSGGPGAPGPGAASIAPSSNSFGDAAARQGALTAADGMGYPIAWYAPGSIPGR